jgi:chromosome segregation ATPase
MWDKIKGAIFTDDPEQTPKAAPPAAAPPTIGAAAMAVPGALPVSGQTDNRFVPLIKKAVFAKQTALTTLVQAADSLAEIIPDQTTRFKAAFKTAGSGRTVQQVAAAADIHLADVDGEQLRFRSATDQALGSELSELERHAAQAEQTAKTCSAEIEAMQARITDLQRRANEAQQKHLELTGSIASKKTEVAQTAAEFERAAELVRAEINNLRATVLSSLS